METSLGIKKIINILKKSTGTIMINEGTLISKDNGGFLVYYKSKVGTIPKQGYIACATEDLNRAFKRTREKYIKAKLMAFALGRHYEDL